MAYNTHSVWLLRMGKAANKFRNARLFYSFVGLFILSFVFSFFSDNFLNLSNIITILRQSSVLLVLASGLTAVVITGNIDLSTGTTAGLVGCISAQMLKSNIPVPLVLLFGIMIGGIIGLSNGFLVGVINLPSFIATYGVRWVVSGISVIVMNGAVIYDLPSGFNYFGVGYVGNVPVIIIVASIAVLIMLFLLHKTTTGRAIYAVGSNRDAAHYSGISVKKTLFTAFALSGATAGLAGILMTARLNAAEAAMGDSYGLQMVAAVIIGGTSMLGGEGGIGGTVIGAILLTVIVNMMNLSGISSFAQPLVVGLVILSVIIFDSYSRIRQSKVIK